MLSIVSALLQPLPQSFGHLISSIDMSLQLLAYYIALAMLAVFCYMYSTTPQQRRRHLQQASNQSYNTLNTIWRSVYDNPATAIQQQMQSWWPRPNVQAPAAQAPAVGGTGPATAHVGATAGSTTATSTQAAPYVVANHALRNFKGRGSSVASSKKGSKRTVQHACNELTRQGTPCQLSGIHDIGGGRYLCAVHGRQQGF